MSLGRQLRANIVLPYTAKPADMSMEEQDYDEGR